MPYKGYQRVYRCDNKIFPFDEKKEEWFGTRDKEDKRYNLEEKKGWVQLIGKSMKDERRALSICKMQY